MAVRLGRYEVLKHLASGGMADVLLGRADGIQGFERHVVLKRIKSEHAQDQRFIRMFLDEARLAANLHHQHIVQVHDIGEAAGEYFIAMEYLHGEDVRTILSTASRTRQHVPLGYAMAIVSAAAAGLHYAHERRGPDKRSLGIVHRDVSPSNILVGYDGSIKVVDFGIAKAAARQETRTGSLKGKVSYMSPEQCKSATVDRRSDVYSLGIVLYELATTTRLFKGDSDYLVMDQIVNGRVPLPKTRRADVPDSLAAIIMRAIATDPERRYATAEELRVALDQLANELGLTASTSAVAAYMRRQFGEKPEPWQDLGGRVAAPIDAAGATSGSLPSGAALPSGGWIELWRADEPRRESGIPLPRGAQGSGGIPRQSRALGTDSGAEIREPTPTPRELTPVPRETTPVPRETTPVPREATPVPREVPRERTPMPKLHAAAPREATPVPKLHAAAPREVTPVPREVTPVPRETTPVPRERTPVPREVTPVPRETTPVPRERTPVPREVTPLPRLHTPARGIAAPAPREATPVPREATPVPREATPLPRLHTPARGIATPAPSITPARSTKAASASSAANAQSVPIPIDVETTMPTHPPRWPWAPRRTSPLQIGLFAAPLLVVLGAGAWWVAAPDAKRDGQTGRPDTTRPAGHAASGAPAVPDTAASSRTPRTGRDAAAGSAPTAALQNSPRSGAASGDAAHARGSESPTEIAKRAGGRKPAAKVGESPTSPPAAGAPPARVAAAADASSETLPVTSPPTDSGAPPAAAAPAAPAAAPSETSTTAPAAAPASTAAGNALPVPEPSQLSHTAIDRIAAMHSRELAQCDGGEALHGEVSVRFAVDANGTVIKSQLSSTLSAPKVATCILQAVQNWQFPLQPAGGALGTYTLSFQ